MEAYSSPTDSTGEYYNSIGLAAVGLVGRKYHRIVVCAQVIDVALQLSPAIMVLFTRHRGAAVASPSIEADTDALHNAIYALQVHQGETGQAPWARMDYVLTGTKMEVDHLYPDQFDPASLDTMEAARVLKAKWFPEAAASEPRRGWISLIFGR
ncbi:MAG: hypothetical protein ACK4MX_07025 [Thermaurantiacus sp.]